MNQSREAHHAGAAAPLPRGGPESLQVVANQKRLSAALTLVAQVTDERYGRNILK